MQSLKTQIGAEIRDAQGRFLRSVPFRESHCLLKQFVQIWLVQASQVYMSMIQTSGAAYAAAPNSVAFGTHAVAVKTWGMQIGTGNTPVTMADYKLETPLTTDIGYGSPSWAVENPDSDTWQMCFSRAFTNNSGSDIDVKEVGIICKAGYMAKLFLIERSLYEVTIPAGGTLTMTYKIAVSL